MHTDNDHNKYHTNYFQHQHNAPTANKNKNNYYTRKPTNNMCPNTLMPFLPSSDCEVLPGYVKYLEQAVPG